VHWTYADSGPDGELEQGDILQPTDALKHILLAVHPHFTDDKYLAFLVTTQSCDLVVRGSLPKAAYISIAAIRPLAHVIQKIFRDFAVPTSNGVLPSSSKGEVRRFLERLFNQNEQGAGLFYLHKDADSGIGEPAVAFLRVTVALRADHYEPLLQARVGRLTSEFRAKLGWLIGNLYARPATRDWNENPEDKKAVDGLISQFISRGRWIDDEVIAIARAERLDLMTATDQMIERLRPQSREERALTEIRSELKRVAVDLDENVIKKLENRLRNSGKFKKLFR
jgi:hypothetical protein